jgi:branched chain amino acid efflux pump
MRTDALLTICGMALVTYATRAGGLWIMGRIPPSPLVERWLRQIPGAVLVSIVAPSVFLGGSVQIAAALATVLTAAFTRNILLAMASGVGVVWAAQAFT